jgi:hypothetical protein
LEALGGWCLPRSSKPLSGAGCGVGGGFDSHALPPFGFAELIPLLFTAFVVGALAETVDRRMPLALGMSASGSKRDRPTASRPLRADPI